MTLGRMTDLGTWKLYDVSDCDFTMLTGVTTSLTVLWLTGVSVSSSNSVDFDLPFEHLPFFFRNAKDVADVCAEDPNCPFKMHLDKNVCWGYEENCGLNPRSYSHPICDEESKGWVKTKPEQISTFYNQADFGYIHQVIESLQYICKPEKPDDSSLECSEHLTFCRGRNIMIDFTELLNRTTPVMYDVDVLKEGQIGGKCKFNKDNLKNNMQFMGPLQSWGPEIQHFTQLSQPVIENKGNPSICDMTISGRTYIMKIDATVNMYHHFCDFFNLYASLHVNSSNDSNAFSRNNQIIIWRTYKYQSSFESAFSAFTSNPLMDLNSVKGKRVCFSDVVFPLLPRMIYGLYYNTPIIWGCRNSGLFHAFSRFMLHRLRLDQRVGPNVKKIRVTFMSRKTRFRRVLNEDDLLSKLSAEIPEIVVRKVEFTHGTEFTQQLKIIQETDILIGMHGAGLTHLLFLPDWASVFELYHCEDSNCYSDLARLRGLHYVTWEDTNKLKHFDKDPSIDSEHFQKHANYEFDVDEFIRIVRKSVEHIKSQAKNFNNHDEL